MLYQSETLSLNWLEDGIAELLFHAPNAVNKLDTHTVTRLGDALSVLEQLTPLRGVLLRSTQPSFIVGADITEFLSLFRAPTEYLTQWMAFANTIFNRLEDLPVPTVSAINGYALGGGCECTLATDFRIAADDIRIGLPETRLGIMPGFGGTVRLPRLLGVDSALEMIASGQEIAANQALKIGLIDAIVTIDNLPVAALQVLRDAVAGKHDWRARRQPKREALKLNQTESAMVFATAKAAIMQQAGKNYPAALTAAKSIESSALLHRDEALARETATFIPLARSDTAQALVGIFLNEQAVKAKNKQLAHHIPQPKQAAVLGAGIMGGSIACLAATKGVPVIMKDISEQALRGGMNEVVQQLNKQLLRKKIDSLQMANILNAIQPTQHYVDFGHVDIVVEAVVENPRIKAAVLTETERHLHPDAILTSNTSTIPISLLAQTLQRAENFCGMHFFNPVIRMPLVEVIRGAKTADQTIASVVAWAKHMGKTPIVVNDGPGFFVNRVLFPYFAAFSLLLRDGVDFRRIDKLMEQQFGWPMGPSWLLDVVGIDTAHHAQQVMATAFPQRMAKNYRDAIEVLFDAGCYGQKNQRGFWCWESDNKGRMQKRDNPEIDHLFQTIRQPTTDIDDQAIIARMMIPMINEVVRCLEEGIIASPAEADLALVYGLGFPPFRGGIFRYLDTLGNPQFLAQATVYHTLGPLYHLPELLRDKAQNSASWYPPAAPCSDIVRQLA